MEHGINSKLYVVHAKQNKQLWCQNAAFHFGNYILMSALGPDCAKTFQSAPREALAAFRKPTEAIHQVDYNNGCS